MDSFRLVYFECQIFDENICYKFSPDEELEYSAPYVTLLIGPNGTGKSKLLRAITDAINDLYLFYNEGYNIGRNENFVFKNNFKITYFLRDVKYCFIKTGRADLSFEINDLPGSKDDMELPSKVIAISYTISDRFPVTFSNLLMARHDRYDNDLYHYLGIKHNRSSASPTGHIFRTLDCLTSAIYTPFFRQNVNNIFRFLKLDPIIKIEYSRGGKVKNDEFFDGELTVTKLVNLYNRYKEGGGGGLRISVLEKLVIDNSGFLENFINFINSIPHSLGIKNSMEFDFQSNEAYQESDINSYKFLNLGRKLNLLTYRKILLRRNQHEFEWTDSSSGESLILASMLSLASVIDPYSLILIDEPETSLHPNWQMKYFDLIYQVFNSFSNSHFIVASHSHFLGSDLMPSSSSILSLFLKEDHSVESHFLPQDTYGWSAEQILLEIFQVPTTRNYYVAERVGEILELVSKFDRDDDLIRIKVQELINMNILFLTDEDPLKPIIDKLVTKYG